MAAPKIKTSQKTIVARWDDTNKQYVAWDGAIEATVIADDSGAAGTATDGSVTLSAANTWKQVPNVVPSNDYVLVVTIETITGTIRWSFSNGGTPGSTNGNKMVSSEIAFVLGGGQSVYVGSTQATDVVNWSAKELS